MSPWLSDLFLGSQSDERLAALARAGHQRAFTAIVERYRRELNAQARRLDAQRSDDLVQQTFLCAFSALQEDTEVRHVRGWLYRILRNLASHPSRSSVAETELDDAQAVTESAHQTAERKMLAFATLAEIARLPAQQHAALIQTAIQGRARAEVADLMGVSEGAVRQLVHRARATLRTAVTAITPLPLARWFAGARPLQGPVGAEAAVGAGTASAGGIAVKVGAVIASGVLATGVVTAIPQRHGSRPSRARVHAAHLEGARQQPASVIAEGTAQAESRLALRLDAHPFGRPDRASKEKGIGRDGSSEERQSSPEDRGSSSGADRRDGGTDAGSSSSASGDGGDRTSGSASGSGSAQTGSRDGGGSGSDGGSSVMATISSDGGSSSGSGSSGSSGSSDGSSLSATSGAGATSDGGGGTTGGDTSTTSGTTDSSGG